MRRQQPWPSASITLMESAVSSSLVGARRGIGISIFTVDRDIVEVNVVAGDVRLGGDDNRLVGVFMVE